MPSGNIKTLYEDNAQSTAIFPTTKVEAITDENGTALSTLIHHATSWENITVSGTPTALASYESWDTNEEFGYSLDVTVDGIDDTFELTNFVIPTGLLNATAPFVSIGTDTVTLYFKDATAITSSIISLVARPM